MVKEKINTMHPKLKKWQVAINYITLGIIKFSDGTIIKSNENINKNISLQNDIKSLRIE